MDNARLKIRVKPDKENEDYEIGFSVDIGYIQNTKVTISPDITKVGIAGGPSQNTFLMDRGVKKSISQGFIRVADNRNPLMDGLEDTTKWTNGYWLKFVKHYLVNRWQTDTDGCTLYFDAGELDYPPIEDTNVYISSFTHTYVPGAITGNIQTKVGSYRKPKAVAQHVIIYYINDDAHPENSTNMVFMSDKEQVVLKSIPPQWVSDTGKTFNGWSTPDGTKDAGETLNIGDAEKEVNIYAVWS